MTFLPSSPGTDVVVVCMHVYRGAATVPRSPAKLDGLALPERPRARASTPITPR